MSTFALIYHDVVEEDRREEAGFPGPLAARYKLTPEHFERHLHAIGQTGRSVGLAADAPDCAITFDDGGASALLAAEMLERHGWRGHFFITTGRIGTPGFLDADGELPRIDTSGRPSAAWGQPRLTDHLRWKRAARRS